MDVSIEPHDVTAQDVTEFIQILCNAFAEKFGGDKTLNELRVMHHVVGCSLKGQACSVTGIHKAIGIPVPTVSRCVASLQSRGWLCDRQDPHDNRKRLIYLSPRTLEETCDDIEGMARWFNDRREYGVHSRHSCRKHLNR